VTRASSRSRRQSNPLQVTHRGRISKHRGMRSSEAALAPGAFEQAGPPQWQHSHGGVSRPVEWQKQRDKLRHGRSRCSRFGGHDWGSGQTRGGLAFLPSLERSRSTQSRLPRLHIHMACGTGVLGRAVVSARQVRGERIQLGRLSECQIVNRQGIGVCAGTCPRLGAAIATLRMLRFAHRMSYQ
jgi:hypothetical protein